MKSYQMEVSKKENGAYVAQGKIEVFYPMLDELGLNVQPEKEDEEVLFYNEDLGMANKAFPLDLLCSQLKLPEGTVVRTRMPGDLISLDMVGRKKIQDFFVDEKIPRNSRDELPLVAKGNEIIAILGEDILLNEAVTEIITEEENVGPGFGLIRTRVAKGYRLKFEGGYWIIEQTS